MLCMLGGCAGKNASTLDARIQQAFAELPSFTAQVKIISCAGQSPLEYGGLYEYQKEGADTFTLKSPEALSGIAIHIAGEKADEISVQYAETVLEPGLPAQPGMTPADAVPTLLDLLRNAAPQETWEETIGGAKMAAARYETDDGNLTYQIWLTQESLKLSYAECYADGERVLQIAFSEYQT